MGENLALLALMAIALILGVMISELRHTYLVWRKVEPKVLEVEIGDMPAEDLATSMAKFAVKQL